MVLGVWFVIRWMVELFGIWILGDEEVGIGGSGEGRF